MNFKAKIGGKVRPFKVTYGVMRKTANALGCSFVDLETYPEKTAKEFNDYLVYFNFFALEAGAKAKGAEIDFTVDDVQEWFDGMSPEEFTKFQTLQNVIEPKKK